ncbi:MAG TPA: SIMPL domain-containing protein [Alphaproteobacteria bacterium]|nr:SIMPL domain-containing protein [Alphaproteobacteria bacterium]
MHRTPRLILTAALLALPLGLHAADRNDREGAAYWQSVTVVNLSADARRTVTADKLTANVSIERDAKDAAGAQAYVNEKMQLAKVAVGDVAGVKFETGGYNTYQTNNGVGPDGKPLGASKWHARQDVTLSGGKPEDLTRLVSRLQGMGFAVQGLGYSLSQEKNDEVRESLVNEALDNIKAKAQKMADHLGMKNVRYATINLGGDNGIVRPMMYARAAMAKSDMAESMPEPVATAGTVDVQVNVNAEVHMR